MNIPESNTIITGVVFILTLASGIWLRNSGKPLKTGIFNIHKIIALGAVILTAVQINGALYKTDIQIFLLWIFLMGICVVALFATGALMSIGKLNYAILLTIHRVAPFLLAICLAITIYLLAGFNI